MYDELVDEVVVQPGEPTQIGYTPVLSVPVPDGVPFICRISWEGPRQLCIQDGLGDTYHIGVGQELRIHIGPLKVEMMLNATQSLLRTERVSWRGSLAWLVIVLVTSILSQQSAILYAYRCEWFALTPELWVTLRCPVDTQVTDDGGVPSDYLAEYMARLLKRL